MRILAVGDLIGESGLKKAKDVVEELKKKKR